MSNITLKKISQSLGLSISTVSRALKNHPDISEQTKKRVRELAESLEYEPNAFAIQLRTKDSRIFGLLVPTVSNHFYESCIQAIEEESRKNGYTVIILQSGDNPETELSNLRLCKQNRVSGVFACITPNTKDVQPFLKLEDAGIPVIFFDKVPDFEACNKVCTGDIEAAGIAAERIIRKKKKQVLAILGNPNLSITKKRMAAFKEKKKKKVFRLYENYPNPFNPVTKIKFDIASNSEVKLVVYDLLGKVVTTLVSGNLDAGTFETSFEGSNYSSGVYFYRLDAGSYTAIKKMLLTK